MTETAVWQGVVAMVAIVVLGGLMLLGAVIADKHRGQS